MLTSAKIIEVVAKFLSSTPRRPPVVLDPVMISTSGHTLLSDEGVATLSSKLISTVDWITPNIPEAKKLVQSSSEIQSLADLLDLARKVRETFDVVLLLKGGHFEVSRNEIQSIRGKFAITWMEGTSDGETTEICDFFRRRLGAVEEEKLVVDILADKGKELQLFVGTKMSSTSTHGTGCTLSSAIACALAKQTENGEQSCRSLR